jgi:hypothetical protein
LSSEETGCASDWTRTDTTAGDTADTTSAKLGACGAVTATGAAKEDMTWAGIPVESMTAARPATVEVFSTVLREGRPIVLIGKATFFLRHSILAGLSGVVGMTEI